MTQPTPQAATQPTPEPIFALLNAFQQTAALNGAPALDGSCSTYGAAHGDAGTAARQGRTRGWTHQGAAVGIWPRAVRKGSRAAEFGGPSRAAGLAGRTGGRERERHSRRGL